MKKSELIGLVEQVKNGSRDAFRELYEEYYDRLYFFVLKNVGNKEAAEDITQDAFVRSLEKIGTLEKPENYVTWLHTIAYHKCTDLLRSRRCDAYFDTDEELEDAMENHSLNEPVMVPEDYATDKDRARQLKEMIDSLKPDMKSVLILYYYNDMSLADVAKTMGLTENNVKQKLFRARRKLKDKIDAMGGKGIMFAAVPMDEMLHRTVSPKHAAAIAGKSGAASVGTGLAAGKIAGISAAAVMAVGIPLALGNIGKDKHDLKGDIQLHDSSAVTSSAYDSTASSSVESALEDIIASSLSDSSVSEDNTSSRPEEKSASSAAHNETSSASGENYAAPAAGFNATAAVNTSSSDESKADTESNTEEKKETQPVEMSVDKMLSMTPSQLRELSNNDFELIGVADYESVTVAGIRCAAFPNYVFEVSPRFDKGEPEGKLEKYNSLLNAEAFGETKMIFDSEEIKNIVLYGDAVIGEGVSVGMTYNEIKEKLGVNPKVCYVNTTMSPSAILEIEGRIWLVHFALTDEQIQDVWQQILDIREERKSHYTYEELDRLTDENDPINFLNVRVDLSDINPVCDVAVYSLPQTYFERGEQVVGNPLAPYVGNTFADK